MYSKTITWIYLAVLCLGLIVLSTSYFIDLHFVYNEKRIFQLIILIIGALLFNLLFDLDRFRNASFQSLSGKSFWFVVAVLCLSIISAIAANYSFYAFVQLSLYLLLVVLAIIVVFTVIENKQLVRGIFVTACLLTLIYILKFGIGYCFYLTGFKDYPLWPGNGIHMPMFGFANVRFFNQIQAFTLPLLIGSTVISLKENRYLGCFLFSLSSLWWMLLIQSAGRGIILSVLTAGLIVLLLFERYTHKWLWIFLGALVIGFVSKLFLFDLLSEAETSKSILRGKSSRLTLWPKVFFQSLEKPLIGHGPMAFANIKEDFFRGHPHNSVLQLLYEFGYPITVIVLGGIFYGIKNWICQSKDFLKKIKGTSNEQVITRISLSVASFSGLLYSLFSGVIVMPFSQLWLVLIVGTIIGIYHRAKERKDGPQFWFNKINFYVFKFVILIAAGILALILIRDVGTFKRDEQEYFQKTSRNTLHPRFWQQGKIGIEDYHSQD